jgi:glycosyltransferase involved in cell wall biosynthesis
MTRVHQLLPVLSPGDAIGQCVLRIQDVLREQGIGGEIFAEATHQTLLHRSRPAAEIEAVAGSEDVVVYHLSIGARCAAMMERTPARRVLYYHNITPREFYEDVSPRVAYWIDRGRQDLGRLAPLCDLGIAASAFNETELTAAGCTATFVVPPPVDLARLQPRPATPAAPPELLFVSRLAPNKRHDDLLRFLAATRAAGHPDARLIIPGGSDDTAGYAAGLRRLAADLGIADAVDMPMRRVSDAEISEHYERASVVVCASAHEGFGMPVLEAMAFDVPVVAYAAGAIPETTGGAAILLETRDPLVWAGVIDRVLDDHALRSALISRGRRRLADFTDARLRERLHDAFRGLIGDTAA